MNVARQHQEWLQLLEVSGPFLAMPVILKTFPQGLERIDTSTKKDFRLAYQEWLDSQSNEADTEKYHIPWIRFVFKNLLEYPSELLVDETQLPPTFRVSLPEHGEILKPTMAVIWPDTSKKSKPARILISVYPAKQKLDRAISNRESRWTASPAVRMMELLRRSQVPLGIVTNGEHWMLVYAPEGETASLIGWYASVWMEEESTLRSFRSLVSAFRLFGVPEDESLESLLVASKEFQHEVTTQLGVQVRKAIEQLIQAIDRIDKDTGRTLLTDVSESLLYEAGVTVMMRLVFLLAAEERELFPVNNPFYRDNYAIFTLREELEHLASRHGEEVLERRYDAWNRILATFRAIFAGVRHEDLNLPAYGGSLFNPDRFPFLEGRAADTIWHETSVVPLPVNNRTVFHLLDSIQVLRGTRARDEARKLSFRALDVEQIGHVYESLLEHTAVRACDLVLGLEGSKGKEPEVQLSVLQSRRDEGENGLIEFLYEETGKSKNALSKLLERKDRYPEYKVQAVCDNEDRLYRSVKPFVGLVREDSQSMPVIFTPGSVYVTEGTERRATGTHYTPRSLTEPIVRHSLDPILFNELSAGVPPSLSTLRPPREILDLKICDISCGSGAFLVQACRYLSEKLVESWNKCRMDAVESDEIDIFGDRIHSGQHIDPKLIVPRDADDALLLARRLIVDRCIFGVDCNAMAVEMAKLSLWLITMQKERPFAFLDHALRCGDTLIGVSDLDQIRHFSISDLADGSRTIFSGTATEVLDRAGRKRQELESIIAFDVCDTDRKRMLNDEANQLTGQTKTLADILVGLSYLHSSSPSILRREVDSVAIRLAPGLSTLQLNSNGSSSDLKNTYIEVCQLLDGHKLNFIDRYPLHWPLEFPEVFQRNRPGFDAIIGNPPFITGRRILTNLGKNYRDWIGTILFADTTTDSDLVAFFFRRAFSLVRSGGILGLVATKTIAAGKTREAGLGAIENSGATIYRAITNLPWPGDASVTISCVFLMKAMPFDGQKYLNGRLVSSISSFLAPTNESIKPYKLKSQPIKCSEGTHLYGDGFILSKDEFTVLTSEDPRNAEVLSPYLTGESLNNQFDQQPTEYVINFRTMSLEEASSYHKPFEIVVERVKPIRDGLTGQIHESKFWLHWDKRERFYKQIGTLPRIIACSRTTKYLSFSFVPTNWIYSMKLKLFASANSGDLAVLQSVLHESWARKLCDYMGDTLQYNTTAAFKTFPWPKSLDGLQEIGDLYITKRQEVMSDLRIGLTDLYNRFNSSEADNGLLTLRSLQTDLDKAVLNQYGWSDLELEHRLRSTEKGPRYTISDEARTEILKRLLNLNHQRYAEESQNASGKTRKR